MRSIVVDQATPARARRQAGRLWRLVTAAEVALATVGFTAFFLAGPIYRLW